jgi:hypothetical protein
VSSDKYRKRGVCEKRTMESESLSGKTTVWGISSKTERRERKRREREETNEWGGR